MKLLIDIGHPGHVHLFKNLEKRLRAKGHTVYFSTKKHQEIISLLNVLKLEYTILGRKYNNIALKYLSTVIHLFRMYRLVKSKKIDIGIGISGLIATVAKYTSMSSICLDDDDSSITPAYAKHISNADAILTPLALQDDDRGEKHVCYNGYHELAYLHPNRFNPDDSILDELGISKNEKYSLVRFNAFKAHHDQNEHGMTMEQRRQVIKLLKKYGKVFVSMEDDISEFSDYKLMISPEKIHSVLHFSDIFIGESQTMCSEAAVLGTPAIKCNTFSGRLSIPNELEERYGLCHSYHPDNFEEILMKAEEVLASSDISNKYQSQRKTMLSEKIDVTALMTWFIDNYPESIRIMKENPDYQYSFM